MKNQKLRLKRGKNLRLNQLVGQTPSSVFPFRTVFSLAIIVTVFSAAPGRADDSLADACDLGIISGSLTVYGWVGDSDVEDYYSFSLAGTVSDFTVSLGGYGGRAKMWLIEDKNNNHIIDSGETLGGVEGYATQWISQWLNPEYGVSPDDQPGQQGPIVQFQAHMNLLNTADVTLDAGGQFFQRIGVVSDSTPLDDFSLRVHYYEVMFGSRPIETDDNHNEILSILSYN